MKNIFIAFLLLIIFINGCVKDTDSPSTERGELAQAPNLLMSATTSEIKLGIYQYAPLYADSVELTYNIDFFKVIYYTVNANGQAVKASGLIVLPKGISGTSLPLVSFQHGTVLKKEEVPSRLQSGHQIAAIFASEGYVAVCPDYLGLGDSEKLHPYLHAATEATATIDLLRAAKQVCNEKGISFNNQLFLFGYSQGGHATMATFKAIEEDYNDEFDVTACAPMAGSYDMSGTQLSYMLRDASYPSPAYLPYLLFGYKDIYHLFNSPSEVFISPYDEIFPPYFGDNTLVDFGVVNDLWPEGHRILDVLQPAVIEGMKNNPNYSITQALKDNDVYQWVPQSPIALCHCDSDTQVPYENSVVAYNYFTQHGAQDVRIINPFPGGNHTSCAIPSMMFAVRWFNSFKN